MCRPSLKVPATLFRLEASHGGADRILGVFFKEGITTAPSASSECGTLRPRYYGPSPCRRGPVHHLHIPDQQQQPASLLTLTAPNKVERLINLKTSCKLPIWRACISSSACVHLYVFFSALLVLSSLYSSSFPLNDRCSSLPALWLPFFPIASHLWGHWPCGTCHISATRGCDLPHIAHW